MSDSDTDSSRPMVAEDITGVGYYDNDNESYNSDDDYESNEDQQLMNPLTIEHNGRTYIISTEDSLPRNTNLSGFDFSRIRRTPRNSYNGRLNLRGADLSYLNLSNCNLENVDLSYANLIDSNLDRSRIANSIFFESDIEGAKFTNLQSTNGANFTKSITGDTDFAGTDLSNVYFNDWYDKMYPQEADSSLYLTDEQTKQLNRFNRTFPTEEALENAIREGEERLNLPVRFNENAIDEEEESFDYSSDFDENDNEYSRIQRVREQAERDVRQGLNTEQCGMQQADIESNQARLQERLKRATAQALLANNKDESVFGECAICYDPINFGDEAVDAHDIEFENRIQKSGHVFHKDCIMHICNDRFSNKECPECRASLLCKEIENGRRDINTNLGLKGGKRSKRKTNKRKVKSSKKRVTKKRGKKRVTNKKIKKRRVTRRIRRY